jgi:predicted Fe-S protein YdhL (DUF1289 family)
MTYFVHEHKIKYKSGEPCLHRGCMNHRTHPCEGCGRKRAEGYVLEKDQAYIVKSITRPRRKEKR